MKEFTVLFTIKEKDGVITFNTGSLINIKNPKTIILDDEKLTKLYSDMNGLGDKIKAFIEKEYKK